MKANRIMTKYVFKVKIRSKKQIKAAQHKVLLEKKCGNFEHAFNQLE